MLIYARTFDGRTISLEGVQPDDIILTVKIKIQNQINLRVDLQRLVFRDQSLENYRTLSSYGIGEEGVLHLVERSAKSSNIIAGGYGLGNNDRALAFPYGLVIDENQAIIIVDWGNHRIIQWKIGDVNGQVVAGGNGQGNQLNQLNGPTDICIDKETDSFIICDRGNKRIVRWSRRQGTTQGEILLDKIAGLGLAIDNQNCLYISDAEKNEVKRYKMNEKNGIVVAGGHGRGGCLNQLNEPSYIFVDDKQAVYVSDTRNSRVIKWDKDSTEGVIVARGFCRGLFVDKTENVYVADYGNHRVVCWPKEAPEGTIITNANDEEQQMNQIYRPWGLSVDQHDNLYVSDHSNHRVQRFPLKQAT